MPEPRVHTDTCARCGADKAEARRLRFQCKAWGVVYGQHIWGWDDETGEPAPAQSEEG